MDPVLDRLQNVHLKKPRLEPDEARDAMVDCFCVISRSFVKDAELVILADTPDGAIDRVMKALVRDEFEKNGIPYASPTREQLLAMKQVLDDKLAFDSKPTGIKAKHDEVCGIIASKMGVQ